VTEPLATVDAASPWEYVRDARGIITGTRQVAAAEPEEETPPAPVEPPMSQENPEQSGLASSATGAPPGAE